LSRKKADITGVRETPTEAHIEPRLAHLIADRVIFLTGIGFGLKIKAIIRGELNLHVAKDSSNWLPRTACT